MEGDPFMLIEGMTIAGLAVGATKGYIYVRSEYPHAIANLNQAIASAGKAGFLGANMLGSGRAFDLEVRKGAGAYICGEETALLESIEGKRGVVRAKPPLPALSGLFGTADRDQQRAVAGCRAAHSRQGARPSTRTTAWAARAAPCRCSWPVTSSRAA
jgi:NADH:ubiquinone oxidoreductase subunit F (NADH-binding)